MTDRRRSWLLPMQGSQLLPGLVVSRLAWPERHAGSGFWSMPFCCSVTAATHYLGNAYPRSRRNSIRPAEENIFHVQAHCKTGPAAIIRK